VRDESVSGYVELIETKTGPGVWNMAVDEAILEAAGREKCYPLCASIHGRPLVFP
jgi:hypothetical protein